ncbi:MAG: DUF3494 domain-containing protein [Betaproteobacteria bacterium]|nr:MAG: DUF3494 domain-containing protein [Betaproteobacteria bacterium]
MKKFASHSRFLTWFTVLLLSALAAGCGGGGGGQDPVLGGSGVTGTIAPTVTATVPLATTPIVTGVAINSKVTATFSKDMAPATINTSTFTLACPAGTAVAGTVAYVAASRVATFSPTANLPANTTCTATITTGAQDTTGVALANAFVWTFTTAATADVTRPRVTLTVPAAGATGVATNTAITATFTEDMDPATITGTTFTLTGPGATPVAGTVTYAVVAKTATFTPTTTLPASTLLTATITTGATDLAGNALAGNQAALPAASNFVWTFTTSAAPDTTPPTVTLLNPADLATGMCLQKTVNATFSEAMDPLTITTATFTLAAGVTPVSGTVAYDVASRVATFTSTSALAANTSFTATVTTGAKDLAGNALASNRVWTFTTGTQACAPVPPIALGAAAPFGGFGGAAGMTNQGTLTVINGDIGTTGASTLVTGFHDSVGDIYTETPLNVGTVNGRIYTAAPPPGGAGVGGNAATFAIATQALSDANTAFNNLSPASLPGGSDPGAGQLGGLTLAPGVYQAAGGSFQITGSDLTLDAGGDANAVFVFQTASTLTVGAPGAPRSVILINGAQAKNVFWRVGSAATINAAGGGTMVGTIISSAATTFSTAGNVTIVTLEGRALALNASVTMVNTVINVPAP